MRNIYNAIWKRSIIYFILIVYIIEQGSSCLMPYVDLRITVYQLTRRGQRLPQWTVSVCYHFHNKGSSSGSVRYTHLPKGKGFSLELLPVEYSGYFLCGRCITRMGFPRRLRWEKMNQNDRGSAILSKLKVSFSTVFKITMNAKGHENMILSALHLVSRFWTFITCLK